MSEWKELTIGEICLVGDVAHAKVKRVTEGILYLTAKNFNRGELKLDDIDFISEEDFEKLFSKKSKAVTRPQENDILMGIIGSFGNAYRYKTNDSFGISSSVAILRPDTSLIFPMFLEYQINSKSFQKIHEAFSSGSVQGYSNIPTIKTMPIVVPPLDEQRLIAKLIGSIDQKIILLRQQNHDLEDLAQTLFKRWFVEFEFPNENGEPYKSSGGKMVESELGEIPEGWRVGVLGDIYKTTSGGTPSRQIDQYYNSNGFPWIKSKELESVYVIETEEYISENGLKNSSAKLLPKNTILVAMYGATVGELSLTSKDNMTCNQAICAILEGEYSFPFCFLLLKHFKKEWTVLAIGSAQQNLSQVTISGYEIIIPSIQIEKNFTKAVKPFYNCIKNNFKEIQTYTQLRDTLLPKLMSGELRVKI